MIIQVAAADTFEEDCGPQLELFSQYRIPEYWVINLNDCLVYVFCKPGAMAYQDICSLALQGELSPAAHLEMKLPILSRLAVP